MASGLLILLDDIATILDDIALLTKVAAKKTAGVLGDDLALNAQQVTGVEANRELPVVWSVAKGSLINKAILVPVALALSAFTPPWVITTLLIIGGLFLCFEGCEKLAHKYLHPAEKKSHDEALASAIVDPNLDLASVEKEKVKGAIRTDFILSAEIIVITLGTVATSPFMTQLLVLTSISLIMTVGVYGLVAGIVKLDDLGRRMIGTNPDEANLSVTQRTGYLILTSAPYLMKFLSIAGTIAMFLVGGGIIVHNIPALHHLIEPILEPIHAIEPLGPTLASVSQMTIDGVIGLLCGFVVLAVVTLFNRLRGSQLPH